MTSAEAWAKWAQFVWLDGGPIVKTDEELRAAVCQRHDAQVAALTAERESLRTALREARKWTETCDCITSEYGPGEANRIRKLIDAALPPETERSALDDQ